MAERAEEAKFVFPRMANYLLPVLLVAVVGGALYVPTLIGLAGSTQAKDVGYAPVQPVEYSHALHAGQLGIDCRYCHSTVERAAYAAVPPTQVCMNCHGTEAGQGGARVGPGIKWDSPKLQLVRQSWAEGTPIQWYKVHMLPDYVFFNHSAHVNKGVGCVECHGRVDRMERVRQEKPLSMSWCLDCHRAPEQHLRPVDQITNMNWQPPGGDQLKLGLELKKQYGIRDVSYMTSCSTCHR